jgi:Flp pilus assembly protein TadG
VKRIADRARAEDGAVLVVVAILLVALLGMAAFAVDLSHARAAKLSAQSVGDFAALAAGEQLGNAVVGTAGATIAGACQDAYGYIQSNLPELSSISANCNMLPTYSACASGSAATNATFSGSTSPYTITIRYPVDDSEISDSASRPAGSDGTRCERMLVRVERENTTAFGGILGVGSVSSGASAVIYATGVALGDRAPALLMVERFGCEVVSTSGQGGIWVKKWDADNPGSIHADSAGLLASPGGCTTNSNAGGYVVYGTAIPSGGSRPNEPSILAEGSGALCPNTTTGRGEFSLVAVASASTRTAADIPNGVCPDFTPGEVSSRKLADDRYNSSANGNGLDTLRSTSNTLFGLTGTPSVLSAAPYNYTVWPTNASDCTSNTNLPDVTASKVFINCNALSAKGVTFTGTTFLVKGSIDLGNNETVSFPNATEILVGGCGSVACTAGGVAIGGTLNVNTGSFGSCASRTGTGVAPTHLVVRYGAFTSSANGAIHLCQTFVYMSGEAISQDTTTTAIGATACSASKPCPKSPTSGYTGSLNLQGDTDWYAPNQLTGGAADTTNRFEDLAFWTEAGANAASSSLNSGVKGTAFTKIVGVLFMPNAWFEFQGQSGVNVDQNAQFIARRMKLSGQGDLRMLPNPADSLTTPVPTWRLIR